MGPDDRQLLRRTHAGHEASARELWDRHAGWMLALARSLLGRRATLSPEDAVQATFCRILELDRRTIRAVREVRPWLAALLRRQTLNGLRSARRAVRRDLARPAPAPRSAEPAPDLHHALDRLPRRLREILHLRHLVGLSTDQTALALGIPRGTVASRHHAALAALRQTLERAAPVSSDEKGGPLHAHTH